MSILSSPDVKQLSQIIHSTSRALGRPSKLSSHRELLSQLLGFRDWNVACAMLPDRISNTTQIAMALVQVSSSVPKFLMATGVDALWRLPEKVCAHLIHQSLDPKELRVSSWSRPDPVNKEEEIRYWFYDLALAAGHVEHHRVAMDPGEPDYSCHDLTPAVVRFTNAQARESLTITLWAITLHSESRTATAFTEASSMPIYNVFVNSITGQSPELREAYCLINSRQSGFANAIVRCDERGRELEIVEHLPQMAPDAVWGILAHYNNALGLSLRDVADITDACVSEDNAYAGDI